MNVQPKINKGNSLIYQVDDNYVARRKVHSEPGHEHHHLHHGGVDYNVGRYAPKIGLGKVIVPVNNAEKV